jgi:N-acetylglucosamine malate deacetylase 1
VSIDVLAVGAHPDDVELGIGGLIHKLVHQGYQVGILDLTRGEMSSRGTVEERAVESSNAANIMGVVCRENAGLPDGKLANTWEQQQQIIPFVRRLHPKMIFATMSGDRHPDHTTAHYLVRDTLYFSGLSRIKTGHEPYRPPFVYYYHPYYEMGFPTMIVDISNYFEKKVAALRAHTSQFFNPDYPGPATHISSESFWKSIATRAAYWGSRINVPYGEVLYAIDSINIALPPGLEKTP